MTRFAAIALTAFFVLRTATISLAPNQEASLPVSCDDSQNPVATLRAVAPSYQWTDHAPSRICEAGWSVLGMRPFFDPDADPAVSSPRGFTFRVLNTGRCESTFVAQVTCAGEE